VVEKIDIKSSTDSNSISILFRRCVSSRFFLRRDREYLDHPFGHIRLRSMSVTASVQGTVVTVAGTARLVDALGNLHKSELEVIAIEDWKKA
jgi:hypothetical protein